MFELDLKLCAWNFLHHYRFAFRDGVRAAHEVLVPLPRDFVTILQQLEGKGRHSSHALCCWSHGRDVQACIECELRAVLERLCISEVTESQLTVAAAAREQQHMIS